MKRTFTAFAVLSFSLTSFAQEPLTSGPPKVEDHSPIAPPAGTGKTSTFQLSSPLHTVVDGLVAEEKAKKDLFTDMTALRDRLALPFGEIDSEEGKKTADLLFKVVEGAAKQSWPSGARNLFIEVLKKDNALSTYMFALLLDRMPQEHWTASFHNAALDLLESGKNHSLKSLIARAPLIPNSKFPLRPDSPRWRQVFQTVADGETNPVHASVASDAAWTLHAAGVRIKQPKSLPLMPANSTFLQRAQVALARGLDPALDKSIKDTEAKSLASQQAHIAHMETEGPKRAERIFRARLERKTRIWVDDDMEVPLEWD